MSATKETPQRMQGNLMSTSERESEMLKLKAISERFNALMAELPTAREMEISQQYPRMPRERVVRMVAAEQAVTVTA